MHLWKLMLMRFIWEEQQMAGWKKEKFCCSRLTCRRTIARQSNNTTQRNATQRNAQAAEGIARVAC